MAIDDKVSVIDASEDLANKFSNKLDKLGYHLSYGYKYKENEPTIIVHAQYTSWLRIFSKFGPKILQKKVESLIPQTYDYNGKTFPVEFSVASVGRFL